MLVAKGCNQNFLANFDLRCPNGFDFSRTDQRLHSYYKIVTELAEIFNYTGLYTSIDLDYISQTNFINGFVENLPNGNPAYISYNRNSLLVETAIFYTKGRINNPNNLKPACLWYYGNGEVERAYFYSNGILEDPALNVPAEWRFRDGKPYSTCHYKNGKITDPKPGKAALVYYDSQGRQITNITITIFGI